MALTEQKVVPVAAVSVASAPEAPFRVLPEKTVIPDPPAGALVRPKLAERLNPVRRRLTVLVAPGGFGKTTLLADCCRSIVANGGQVIWLSVDEEDDANRVVAHFAYAANLSPSVDGSTPPQTSGIYGLDSLLDGIRSDGRPWVVAVDELERLPDSGARVIDHLVWRGPANLHVALACREVPRSIDVATPVAEGRGIVAGVEDLRFTLAEFGAFFGGGVSREKLRRLWAEAEGWPIAACLQRNAGATGSGDLSALSHNWVATRLMRGLAASDRRFLVEAACFEWTDVQMFEQVMGPGSVQRLRRLPILQGLVQGVDGGASFRLHALVRRHALHELRMLGDDGELHRRIARALASRGRTVDAMHHALDANDGDLAADILDDAGAVRLVLRDGVRGLQDAVALVPEDTMRRHPRLRLALHAVGMVNAEFPRGMVDGILSTHVEQDDGDYELQADRLILSGLLLMCSCAPIRSREMESTIEASHRLLAEYRLEPLAVGGFHYGHAVFNYQRGDLAAALGDARRVSGFADAGPSAALSARIVEGAALFARGDLQESEAVLASAQRAAQRDFTGHESPELICNAFSAEVCLEANRVTLAGRRAPTLGRLARVGAWLDVYASAIDVRVEIAFREGASDRALKILEDAWTFARSRHLATFVRWLAAMRVSALVRVGKAHEAEGVWREEGLPADDAALADLEHQGWREMEAVCGTRVRLLVAAERYDEALGVARAYAATARNGGLVRSESWATALAMHAAWLAGDVATAQEALIEHLRILKRSGFSRALAEHAEAAMAVIHGLDTVPAELNAAKETALSVIGSVRGDSLEVDLTPRETQIVAHLHHASNKEIAQVVGMTENGVRYHLKSIFGKLGVRDRRAAADKARSLGLLPPPGGRTLNGSGTR